MAERQKSGYWHESARPLVSLVFIAPMLLAYEAGVLALGHEALRNGADVWMRQFLDLFGFGQYFLLPLLTCGILFAWHHVSRQPWRFNASVLYGMAVESLGFGLLLLMFANWQSAVFASFQASAGERPRAVSVEPVAWRAFERLPVMATTADNGIPEMASRWKNSLSTICGYLGAGIYEELLFRLMLLPAAYGLLRLFDIKPRWAMLTAAIATSLLFSAAHYQFEFSFAGREFAMPGEAFGWQSFLFRAIAGFVFCQLFLYRGFGITAGAHALYDVFTVVF